MERASRAQVAAAVYVFGFMFPCLCIVGETLLDFALLYKTTLVTCRPERVLSDEILDEFMHTSLAQDMCLMLAVWRLTQLGLADAKVSKGGTTLQRALATPLGFTSHPIFGTACWRRREFVWRAARLLFLSHTRFSVVLLDTLLLLGFSESRRPGMAARISFVSSLPSCARATASNVTTDTPQTSGARLQHACGLWQGRVAGVMWDADLSTKVADPRLAGEFAAMGELRRASRSFETLSSITAARRVLGEWVDCYLFLRAGLLPLICRHVNAGTNVAHTCSGKASGATSPSGPCDAGSLDVGVAELRMSLAFKLSAADYECVKEPNGVTTALPWWWRTVSKR